MFSLPEKKKKIAITMITSPTHTNFEMGSRGCSPEPISTYSWAGVQPLGAPFAYLWKQFAALNPEWFLVFAAESQFWCLSDTALSLVLENVFLLGTLLPCFMKVKFSLVIKGTDIAGTEALEPEWVKHLTILPKLCAYDSFRKEP